MFLIFSSDKSNTSPLAFKIHDSSEDIAAKAQLSSAQTSFDLVQEQFNLGMKNTVELLREQSTLLNAQNSLLQAKYMAIMNQQLLRFYGGESIMIG